MKVYTIGVYGTSEDSFYRALSLRQVGLFVDIRQRRGMRNPRYAYVNSNYLQRKLSILGIPYAHLKYLAPTTEMRQMQSAADKAANIAKSARTHLAFSYSKAFTEHLHAIGLTPEKLMRDARRAAGIAPGERIDSIALFCVEREPTACHRSIVASEMERLGASISHIRA